MTEEEMLDERYRHAMKHVEACVDIASHHDNARLSHQNLRTGIAGVYVVADALTQLLIEKGVLTKLEVNKAVAEAAEREAERCRLELCQLYGHNVQVVIP